MSGARGAGTCRESVEQWLPLVRWVIARKLSEEARRRIEPGDAYLAGVTGLMSAIRLYDASKGAAFGTYAVHKIRWSILIAAGLTRRGWRPIEASLDETDASGRARIDRVAARPTPPIELPLDIRRALDQLPERQRLALELHRFEDLTLARTGQRLGVSRQRAHQLVCAAQERLRQLLGEGHAA